MKKTLGCFVMSMLITVAAFAEGSGSWQSIDAESRVAFGSVKKGSIGEVHHFRSVKGVVSEQGQLTIDIDLRSVDTGVDIRNKRMIEHVFQGGEKNATVRAEVDIAAVEAMAVGATQLMDFEGTLDLAGISLDIQATLLVARLSDSRVLVSTADFMLLSTESLGINAGIDKLMELAKLPSIARVTPVAVSMVLEKQAM